MRHFLLPLTVLCAACSSSPPPADVCTSSAPPVVITGNFKDGKGFLPTSPPPSINPLPVSATVFSSVLLTRVTLGGVNATLKAGSQFEWEARVYPADLEAARDGGSAYLAIQVTDVCGHTTTLEDVAVVPLGPAAGVAVSGLDLEVEPTTDGGCSYPLNGSTQARVHVTATSASAGGKVRLEASQGTFTGGMAATELTLVNTGTIAEQTVWFTPSREGYATITAFALGSPGDSQTLVIAGPPVLSAPTRVLMRGFDYFAYATTAGNFAACTVEASSAGIASVTLDDGGVISSQTPVRQEPVSCAAPEELRLAVRFDLDAPDGGAITLRCTDSHAQQGSLTFTVDQRAPASPVLVSGLTLEPVFTPAGECSVPLNGAAPLLLRVGASASSAGATVKLDTNQGTFTGGQATTMLSLVASGAGSEQSTWFFPGRAGPAVFSASAPGAASVPRVVTVTGPPEITAPTRALAPGLDYFATVTSNGNLSTCAAEESVAGASVVTVVDPPLGVISGTLSVAQSSVACETPESVRLKISFDAGAPDGGAVTVRCRDTFAQEASATFTLVR